MSNQTDTTTPARGRSFERRLAAYALAGGAAFALADRADAGIIYSGIQNIPITPNNFILLDLNKDGTADLELEDFNNSGPTAAVVLTELNPSENGLVVGVPPGFFGYAKALSSGTTIGPSSPFVQLAKLGGASLPGGTPKLGAWTGGVQNKFLGVAFNFPTDPPSSPPHFGWVRIDLNPDMTGTIVDWAVNDVAGQPILAGQGAVPEPTSLALLGLGAAGVLAWRRSRKKAEPQEPAKVAS
jgi:PEP-CTERM motif